MVKIMLIVRPPAEERRVDELRAMVALLRSAGHRVSARMTFEGGDAARFARAAARARYDLVVAAGGDGTVNEVVNGMAGTSWQPRLGVIPLGTANDFAAGLGLPEDVEAAVAVALGGEALAVDVGVVNERCFVNVSTGGFGAGATQGTARAMKRWVGPLAYIWTGARRLLAYDPGRAVFHADGAEVYRGRFVFFAVGNARRTGGGTRVTPRAEFGDGRLDIVVVCGLSRLDFLSLLPDLRAGTHLESPDVLYFRATEFVVAAESAVAVNADGEPLEGSRFAYRLLPEPLHVMVPSG